MASSDTSETSSTSSVREVSVDGYQVSLLEAGVGGSPLLLVHGFTGAKEDFRDAMNPLADAGYWVVAPDLRGHGGSHAPQSEDEYSLRHFANDLHSLVVALGWERFDLLGHSMGGMIAQFVALDFADDSHGSTGAIERLVLMDTCHGSVEGLDLGILEMGVEVARAEGLEKILEIQKMFGPTFESPAHAKLLANSPEFEQFEDDKFLASSVHMWCAMALAMHSPADRLDSLVVLTMPTLVMVGDEDLRFIGPSERMAEVIPNAELVVIPDAGHSPQFDHPEAWTSSLLEFLGTAQR